MLWGNWTRDRWLVHDHISPSGLWAERVRPQCQMRWRSALLFKQAPLPEACMAKTWSSLLMTNGQIVSLGSKKGRSSILRIRFARFSAGSHPPQVSGPIRKVNTAIILASYHLAISLSSSSTCSPKCRHLHTHWPVTLPPATMRLANLVPLSRYRSMWRRLGCMGSCVR